MRRKCIRYSPEVAEEVLRRLRAGESLYRIEQDPQMPCSTTVMAWSRARPAFGAAVAAAREGMDKYWKGTLPPPPVPRPIGYSEELGETICALIADGATMADLGPMRELPHPWTIFSWINRVPAFAEMYAGACAARAELWAGQSLRIADGRGAREGDPAAGEGLQRDRLRVQTRLTLIRTAAPRRFGFRDKAEEGPETGGYEALLEALLRRRAERDGQGTPGAGVGAPPESGPR
jgi:hypothetical protein